MFSGKQHSAFYLVDKVSALHLSFVWDGSAASCHSMEVLHEEMSLGCKGVLIPCIRSTTPSHTPIFFLLRPWSTGENGAAIKKAELARDVSTLVEWVSAH
jgi:hypothetical protein